MQKTALVIFFLTYFLIGCSKIEDQIVGVWDVNVFEINGNDSTQAIKSQDCYVKMKFESEKESNYSGVNITGADYQKLGCGGLSGYYSISGKDITIGWSSHGFRPVGAFWYFQTHTPTITWSIVKHSSTTIQMETDFEGKNNFLELKK